jgi:hypothetical protein
VFDATTDQSVTVREANYSGLWLAGAFEPLSVLPAQYYARWRNHGPFEGEFRLLFAVLQDAIRCYFHSRTGKTYQRRLEFREVKRWFEDRSDCALFAFENVCGLLGIDSGALRRSLELASGQVSEVNVRRNWLARRAVAKPAAVGGTRRPERHRVKKPTPLPQGRFAEKQRKIASGACS